jgi:hypothetical protein
MLFIDGFYIEIELRGREYLHHYFFHTRRAQESYVRGFDQPAPSQSSPKVHVSPDAYIYLDTPPVAGSMRLEKLGRPGERDYKRLKSSQQFRPAPIYIYIYIYIYILCFFRLQRDDNRTGTRRGPRRCMSCIRRVK